MHIELRTVSPIGAEIAYATPLLVMMPNYWYWCRESPGSMLVLRELHHVSWQVAQLEVGEAVVPEVLQQSAAARRHDIGAAIAGPGRWEELAAGVEEAGCPAGVPVLSLGSRSCRDIASAPIGQATWDQGRLHRRHHSDVAVTHKRCNSIYAYIVYTTDMMQISCFYILTL